MTDCLPNACPYQVPKSSVQGYFLIQSENILIKCFPWYLKICFPDQMNILLHFRSFTFVAVNLIFHGNQVSVSVKPSSPIISGPLPMNTEIDNSTLNLFLVSG